MKEIEQAWVNFPKTKDSDTLIKHYATDYVGFKGGPPETTEDLENMFKQITEQINLGAPLGISYQITDLKVGILTCPSILRGY
jgi:hypothetical protein